MNQKTTMVAVIAAVLILVGGLGFMLMNNGGSNRESANNSSMAGSQSGKMADMNMNQQTAESTEAQETNMVDIKDFKFLPRKITVKKGTTVTWTNQDSIRHDISPMEKNDAFKGSELLGKGESYSFTFNTVGTYNYNCTPHPYMKGTVEVVE